MSRDTLESAAVVGLWAVLSFGALVLFGAA